MAPEHDDAVWLHAGHRVTIVELSECSGLGEAVLREQGGLPVPAPPILVVSGALAAAGSMRPELVLGAAFAACLVADHGWFLVGRRMGRRLLATICRLSLSPDTCVRKTDDLIS